MRLSANTAHLYNSFGIEKTIDIMAEAGFDAMDLSAFSNEFCTDMYDKNHFLEMRKYAQDKGICFNQAHAPHGSSFTDEAKTRERFNEIVTAMKISSYLGIETIIVHPCQHLIYDDEKNPEKLFEYNMDFYKKLIPYCEEYGIKVALENMWQYPGVISHSTCSKPDEFIRYVDELNNDCFVACLDIGHCVLVREKPDDFIRALGNKRLKCLHVHDVDGFYDIHTMPYLGIADWEKITKALAEIDYQGDFTYEVKPFAARSEECGYKRKLPEELFADFYRLMSATGRYLIGKIQEMKKEL